MTMRRTTGLVALMLVLAACGSNASAKSNADKCKSIGGVYDTASRACILQAE
jgi:hypothetical protein